MLKGHTANVTSLAFNNRDILASGSIDKTIKLWNLERKEEIATLKGNENFINCVYFHNNGIIVVSSSDD